MAHLLLLEVPGGNDFTVLEDAVALGHAVTFVTGDLGQYERQGETTRAALAQAREVLEVAPFDYEALERRALAVHAEHPFDAVLCILDIRIIEAARLARRLGLRFLNPETAKLARDKVAVRQALARRGVRQPAFALARDVEELRRAVAEIGYPALVKPSDGYGSQNVSVLVSDADLDGLARRIEALAARPTDYGLGVAANNRFSVERYVKGAMIGADVFTGAHERVFLGVNDKAMFPPPSFAMRGSCFPSERHDTAAIRDYAYAVLDAIGFDFGAAHIEMIVAEDGPYLVEVNPRLVSAQIPFQMAYALGRSVYADLIHMHLGGSLAGLDQLEPVGFSAIRWIVADRPGRLAGLALPQAGPAIRRVVLFKAEGDEVRPPLSNGDRIGYAIALGDTQSEAEAFAEDYVRGCAVRLA
jgi:biotin carboxylase